MPNIEPADLLDSAGVAELIGLDNRNGVSVYRSRYGDFPSPFIERGRWVLWLRSDIEAWSGSREPVPAARPASKP